MGTAPEESVDQQAVLEALEQRNFIGAADPAAPTAKRREESVDQQAVLEALYQRNFI